MNHRDLVHTTQIVSQDRYPRSEFPSLTKSELEIHCKVLNWTIPEGCCKFFPFPTTIRHYGHGVPGKSFIKSEQAAVAVASKSGVGVRVSVGVYVPVGVTIVVASVVEVGVFVNSGGSVINPMGVSEGVTVSVNLGPVIGMANPQSSIQVNNKYPRNIDIAVSMIMTINIIRIVRLILLTLGVCSSLLLRRSSMGHSLR